MLIKVPDPIMSNGEAVGCCKFPFLEAQAVHVVLSTAMIGTETDGIIVCSYYYCATTKMVSFVNRAKSAIRKFAF